MSAQTGVEMEAMVAVQRRRAHGLRHGQGTGAGVVIEQVVLLEKTGGRNDWRLESR